MPRRVALILGVTVEMLDFNGALAVEADNMQSEPTHVGSSNVRLGLLTTR